MCRGQAAPPPPSLSAPRIWPCRTSSRAVEPVWLEHQLVRVPLKALKSIVLANHCLAEKKVAAVISSIGASLQEGSEDIAINHLMSLVSRGRFFPTKRNKRAWELHKQVHKLILEIVKESREESKCTTYMQSY
ncbi:hypothetical protein GUJ93_ZPchr0010g8552 [Zizania palustris]|uniref:Uncharacterized protein n=1 Tax=Zizania palustris TaxID=103762 RepID=A0A8J5WCT3_ZIZPA|nr:hypothetical protein GUJ93_ZPchr0010g8552 [Zizania palustris]